MDAHLAGRQPAAGGERPKGLVVVRADDPASAEYFRHEGLVARERWTAEVVMLEQAHNYLPLGEYTLESAWPPGFRVSPQHFTVSADRSVYLTITRLPPPGPGGFRGGPPPPGGPPFPPPPGAPPPRPPRRWAAPTKRPGAACCPAYYLPGRTGRSEGLPPYVSKKH